MAGDTLSFLVQNGLLFKALWDLCNFQYATYREGVTKLWRGEIKATPNGPLSAASLPQARSAAEFYVLNGAESAQRIRLVRRAGRRKFQSVPNRSGEFFPPR